jgi:outer membrane protein OmpA-like peptidoglycan-associated protein/tetratricopeptide (TPR) repeat protein
MKIKKIYFLLVIIFLCNFLAIGQDKVRIHRSEFKTKQEGFREAWKAIKKGNKSYKFGEATYRKARENYLKAYKYNEKNAELNYKIGITYLYADDKFLAIKYLKQAFGLNSEVTKDIHYQLGRAYQMNYDFDNAIKEYEAFRLAISPRKLRKKNINLDQLIEDCRTGKLLASHPVRVVIQDMGKNVNSEYDDYYPVLDSKGETMYFTSRRSSKENAKRSLLDKKFDENIYVTHKNGKEWSRAELAGKKITTKQNEAALALSSDGKQLYMYKSKGNGDFYVSTFDDGIWRKPKPLRKLNSRARETSLSITADGKKIYFVSDRKKGSMGGKDIWVSELNEKGRWTKPKNLGPTINTSQNEECVYISRDGKTLYFSSNGYPGMGGYDIFKSTLDNNGHWSTPENLGYPINTPDDDRYFVMLENNKVAYLSSNRESGIGGIDIYKVVFLGAAKEMIPAIVNSPLAFVQYDTKTLFRKPIELLKVDSSVYMQGKIIDDETQQPVVAKMDIIDSDKGKLIATLITDTTGNYRVRIPIKKPYGVQIAAKSYLLYLDIINLSKEKGEIIYKDFKIQRIEVGAKVVMKSIFFETGKATLKPESYQQLDDVAQFLSDNSTVRLEISGHTDNVGTIYYNKKLSEARAKAVVEYLVKQGILRTRLEYKGYGPTQPVAKNNTADGRAQNRRVEFKILSK